MKLCPYATGLFGCSALKSVGYASSNITISESWRNEYCTSGKYQQCPNLKTAQDMKKNSTKSKGGRLSTSSDAAKNPFFSKPKPSKEKTPGKFNPVHAHGGVPPHFCEKPWRSSSLRFRVSRSLFYEKPWK